MFTEVAIVTPLDSSCKSALTVHMEMVLVCPFMYRPESLSPHFPSLPHSEQTFSKKWMIRKSIIYALPVTYQMGWEDIDLPDGRPPLTS